MKGPPVTASGLALLASGNLFSLFFHRLRALLDTVHIASDSFPDSHLPACAATLFHYCIPADHGIQIFLILSPFSTYFFVQTCPGDAACLPKEPFDAVQAARGHFAGRSIGFSPFPK